MTENYPLLSEELKLWQNLYNQSLTIDGKESIIQTDGTRQLVLLPMMTYTLISTMLQKLKYLPNNCFNRIVIGETPICGLRPLSRTSPSLMYKLTEILRTIVDGVRKQHILSITMIFYKNNDINTIYDSYSLVFDYTIKLSDDESTTSIHMIAHIIHQIEYMFNWNDALPNDVELTFVLSTLDQFENKENKVPTPFHFVKQNIKKTYTENETSHLMGRLTTSDGKMWLKFLPNTRQLSGSSVRSDDLPTKANLLAPKQKIIDIEKYNKSKSPMQTIQPTIVKSPKLKKSTKKLTTSIDSSKSGTNLPSSISTRNKKKTGLLSTVKSLITPSRTPAPITSSTPNIADLVLIRHTSTPKPGETASRITIGGNDEAPPLSAIYEVSTSDIRPPANVTSPTPSTITATDISTASTPMIAIERRSTGRAPTVRGQAATAREKIASMQIRDDDDDEELFKKLFSRQKTKKSKNTAVVPTKKSDDLSDVSTISSATSTTESIFTPPTARKRPTTDRMDDDDFAAEHSTPPKTPRTSRRNRIDDQTSTQATLIDISDSQVNLDSPRLLRSVTKKLQQQASGMFYIICQICKTRNKHFVLAKKKLAYEQETIVSDQSKTQNTTKDEEDMDSVYVHLERSSIGLHYSMGK
ncbi:unnamed protein product [Rotaria sp. Silwood1]|nr:unnamed protein product [Rotaria sp. Silwood1]